MIFSPGDERQVEIFLQELREKDCFKTRSIEKYGFGAILRSFFGLPSNVPLNIKSQHGVCLWDEIPPSERVSRYKVILVFSRRWLKTWHEAKVGKLVLGLPNPFLLYKRKHNICRLPDVTGCVFFYAHSTIYDLSEVDNFSIIQTLRNIPSDFGECLIAMHYVDMLRGEYKAFLDAGFKVFCAGHYSDSQFVVRFYNMISRRRYALSNSIGSHYFYCVEHGLPFSYIGFSPEYRNIGYDSASWEAVKRAQEHAKSAHKLEVGFVRSISSQQLKYVESELGADLHISRCGFYFALVFALFSGFSGFLYGKLRGALRAVKVFCLRWRG